jgi:hypothetical protein
MLKTLTYPLSAHYKSWILSLVNDLLDAQFLLSVIRLLQSSTCFEQRCAHHQELSCINTASSIVTLCRWPSGMQVEKELLDLHTGRPLTDSDYTRCCINTIGLLMMSTTLLETRRELH